MKAEQGYVHVPLHAGSGDGLTITPSESATCSRCGVRGGDFALFSVVTLTGDVYALRIHAACLEALLYMYRTGRNPRKPKGV